LEPARSWNHIQAGTIPPPASKSCLHHPAAPSATPFPQPELYRAPLLKTLRISLHVSFRASAPRPQRDSKENDRSRNGRGLCRIPRKHHQPPRLLACLAPVSQEPADPFSGASCKGSLLTWVGGGEVGKTLHGRGPRGPGGVSSKPDRFGGKRGQMMTGTFARSGTWKKGSNSQYQKWPSKFRGTKDDLKPNGNFHRKKKTPTLWDLL